MIITNWQTMNQSKREPSWINTGNKFYGKAIHITYSSIKGDYVVQPSKIFKAPNKRFSNINGAKRYAVRIMKRNK